MFDLLPTGFDFNDVRFYSTLLVMIGFAALGWRLRRDARSQRVEAHQLALDEAVARTGVVGEARPVSRVRA